MLRNLLTLGLFSWFSAFLLASSLPQEPASEVQAALQEFADKGVHVDLDAGTIRIQGEICQLYEPLEYLLVKQPQGKDYEALLSTTEMSATALNAAMLMLGVEKGENGEVVPTDPQPTPEEVQAGAMPYTFTPAHGDGFYIYVSWEKEIGDHIEHYRYRAEDLVLNVREERTYQRGRFVYLGSRFIRPHKDAKEFFAAEGEGNLVSLVHFRPANHLLGGSDPSSNNQSIWYPNVFLLPPIGHPVEILFTRELLEPGLQ